MMEREGEISIEDLPATFKSFVWQHFGFPVEIGKLRKSDRQDEHNM